MNLEIKKIRINELGAFWKSEAFLGLKHVPISPARAKSYVNNPNAKPGDVALYLGFVENELVAYRSLFAGIAQTGGGATRFGWCSGSWVHPNFRRKGYSKILLQEAYSDWDGKLMFTNYAPESEKLYLSTGWFRQVHEFKGVRAYLFPKSQKLIPLAKKYKWMKPVFGLADASISMVSKTRCVFFNEKIKSSFRFEELASPDKQCYQFLKNHDQKLFFNRKENELKWIFEFPWISDENKEVADKYQFTSVSSSFYYRAIKVFYENSFAGFFIFSVKDGHLKTLYFSQLKSFENEIAVFLKQYCVKNNIAMATIYNSSLAGVLFKRKFPFLHLKNYGQKIYGSFHVGKIEEYNFQDGDGDVIFT
ncbi:MAG TPA: GNAT family N-acetyltransferase [Prolixibacteraceae bacterium]|nr:GNAT family N-acetyltransferase [Prolixibacteraceae bacterium]